MGEESPKRLSRFFLDTNILVYTFEKRDASKRQRAQALVAAALHERSGIISFQVVQEFLNVATRKFATPLSDQDCLLYLRRVLGPLCEVHSSVALYDEALDVKSRWKLSFFDSLIVAAALSSGCDVLYSEDMHDGLKIRDTTIINPFLGVR